MDQVLRTRGVKAVDLRAAGLTVRFQLESPIVAAAGVGSSQATTEATCRRGEYQGDRNIDISEKTELGAGEGVTHGAANAAIHSPTVAATGPPSVTATAVQHCCYQLLIGSCVYQKGKYLLGHVDSTSARSRPTSARPMPSPPPGFVLPFVLEDSEEKNHASIERGFLDDSRPASDRGNEVTSPKLRRSVSVESGLSQMKTRTGAAQSFHWGGGPGPRPCKEALTIIQALRMPMSDPHYFRVDDLALYLDTPMTPAGGEFVGRTQVLGGGEDAGRGWAGEMLVTRCAVLGNPGQPGTRADAMLSRIRVEVTRGSQ